MYVEKQDKIRHHTCNGHTYLVPTGDHGDSICTLSMFNLITLDASFVPLGQVWTTIFH